MKQSALVIILAACLLALTPRISAQLINSTSTDMPGPSTGCEQAQNLSPVCRFAYSQALIEGPDQAESFCGGACFETVVSAYESCGSAGDGVVRDIQEGEKFLLIIHDYACNQFTINYLILTSPVAIHFLAIIR